MGRTTISIDTEVRERLRTFGTKGMDYDEILMRLMDEVEREQFVRELRRQYGETPREDYLHLEDL